MREHAKKTCVVFAPNFSPGVNLLLGMIEMAAPILAGEAEIVWPDDAREALRDEVTRTLERYP